MKDNTHHWVIHCLFLVWFCVMLFNQVTQINRLQKSNLGIQKIELKVDQNRLEIEQIRLKLEEVLQKT